MKQKEKDNIIHIYEEYGYQCFVCGNRATQRAHIIGNTKLNRKLYGDAVIDDPLNWLPACGLEHNKQVDAGTIPANQQAVADIITSDMSYKDKRHYIEELVKERIR
jgi:hypothetical protein